MDRQFLKFWGEFMLNAAEGRRQLDEMVRWMQSGCPPLGGLAERFRACYGLPAAASAQDDDQWRQATSAFRAALDAYAPLWGWIPVERYNRLKRKTERLEATVAEQARLIQQFEALLGERNMGDMALITRFQNVIADQRQAFEKLMQTLVPSSQTPDEPNEP